MDLFKLVGEIAIRGADKAKQEIGEVGKSAQQTANTISKSNQSTQTSNKSAGTSFGSLKSRVAEYKAQGMTTSQAWRQAAQDMRSSTEKAGSGMSSALRKVATAAGALLTVNAVKNFGLGCIQAAADAQAMESQFSQVFGDLEGSASKSLSNIASEAGISENRMKGSFTKIAAFAKTTGMDTESALSLSERAMVAVADSAAFYDRSLEDTTESLQSFLKGNYENDAALGLSCTETTRNAAANKLYGKSFNELSESQKQLTLLQMVEDANKASGALGQAARESDTWTNVIGNLKQSFTDFQANLGKYVLPMVTNLVKRFTGFVETATSKIEPAVQFLTEKFKALKEWLGEIGEYTSSRFQPTIENLQTVFNAVKDAVQPLIEKFTEYVTGGQGAEDATNLLKDAIDLLADAAKSVTDGLVAFSDWCSEHKSTLETIAVVVGSFAAAWVLVNGAMKLWNVVGIISTAVTTGFASAMAFLTSPVTLVVAAIAAVIAIGVLLYKNWDTIKEKCSQFGAQIKEKFNSMKESVVNKVTELKDKAAEKFNELKNKASTAASNLKDKVSSAFQNAKDKATTAFSTMKNKVVEHASSVAAKAKEKFNSMRSSISLAVSKAKSLAVAAFSAIKSNISTHVSGALTTVSNKFNSIKSKISDAMESAKTTVKNAVEKLKGFFDFDWSLPNIKLPHFSVTGGEAPWGFGGQGSLPKVSVQWYRKAYDQAMILNDPTIFGYSGASGKMLGGGDGNGNEVVAGEKHLMNLIGQVVESKTGEQNNRIIEILIAILHAITGGNEDLLRALLAGQNSGISERDFARLVRKYA